MRSLILAVDFDGTCVEFDPDLLPSHGPDLEGAVDTLRDLATAGYRLVLWTCRQDHPTDPEKQYLTVAVNWFESRGIPLAGINAHPDGNEPGWSWANPRKIYADIYLEDRVIGGFCGWDAIRQQLLVEET